MTASEKIALIESKRKKLVYEIREADRYAHRDPKAQYDIVLFPEGWIMTKNQRAGYTPTYHPDLIVIGHICHRCDDIMHDPEINGMMASEMLDLLMENMDRLERDCFEDYCLDYEDETGYCPSIGECLDWIEYRCSVWNIIKNRLIREITGSPEAKERYNELIDEEIETIRAEEKI